jgi:hypothetical protein
MSDTTDTPTDTDLNATREGFLRRAAAILRVTIEQVSGIVVPEFHVSMGFGGLSYERGVRGVCWHTSQSDDGRNHVFISPELSDTGVVLSVLLHEMLHVALDNADGHRGRFAEYATRLGLMAPFTTATPDISLTSELMVIAAELGEFPHGALHVSRKPVEAPVGILVGGPVGLSPTSGPGPQTNRWVSVTCPTHGGSVRMSRSRLAQGAPLCGMDVMDGEGVGVCTHRMIAK